MFISLPFVVKLLKY